MDVTPVSKMSSMISVFTVSGGWSESQAIRQEARGRDSWYSNRLKTSDRETEGKDNSVGTATD